MRIRAHFVYYCYATDGTLLYVGCSTSPGSRIQSHGWAKSVWLPFCSRVVVSEGMTRTKALEVETREIRRLRPAYNVQHNPRPYRPEGLHLVKTAPEIEWLDPVNRAWCYSIDLGAAMVGVTHDELCRANARGEIPFRWHSGVPTVAVDDLRRFQRSLKVGAELAQSTSRRSA